VVAGREAGGLDVNMREHPAGGILGRIEPGQRRRAAALRSVTCSSPSLVARRSPALQSAPCLAPCIFAP
jgi:hypothetical protein